MTEADIPTFPKSLICCAFPLWAPDLFVGADYLGLWGFKLISPANLLLMCLLVACGIGLGAALLCAECGLIDIARGIPCSLDFDFCFPGPILFQGP